MERQFDVVVEKDSAGYFVASVPALLGWHTQARSLDELMEYVREAIELCLEVQDKPPELLELVGCSGLPLRHDLPPEPDQQGRDRRIEQAGF